MMEKGGPNMNENSLAVFEDYKIHLNKEGSETVTKCNRLKLQE